MPDDQSVSRKGKAKAKVGGSSLSVSAASVPPDWSLPDLPGGSMSSLVYEAHDVSRDKGKRKATDTSLSEVFHTDSTSQKQLPASSVGYGCSSVDFSFYYGTKVDGFGLIMDSVSLCHCLLGKRTMNVPHVMQVTSERLISSFEKHVEGTERMETIGFQQLCFQIARKKKASLAVGVVPFVYAKEYNVHPTILSAA